MGNAKSKAKGVVTRTKSGKSIKKPQRNSTQDCVLISVKTANSRKRQKQREAAKERMRKFRARQAEVKLAEKAKHAKKIKQTKKK